MSGNKYLKAFTLLELVVVMLLMGIVVSVSYKGFLLIQALYADFEAKKTLLLQQEEVLGRLRLEIEYAEDIQWESNVLSLKIGKNDYLYQMDEMGITRIQGNQRLFYPLVIQELQINQNLSGITESVTCLVSIEGNLVETIFPCRKDASTIINWNSENGITDPF